MKIKKYLLLITGVISVIPGSLGIFIPLLPATPFFLLGASCFFRSSDRFYKWLINHKIFGNYILFYRKYRAISMSSKISSVILLWTTIIYSLFFVVNSLFVKFILIIIAIGVTIHIIRLRTITKEVKFMHTQNIESVKLTDDAT